MSYRDPWDATQIIAMCFLGNTVLRLKQTKYHHKDVLAQQNCRFTNVSELGC